jgi:S-DNA-T family DNA segregation ATPase FtsK/SpoIIIE
VAYRGVIAIARRARTGLLLGRAAAGDGAVLGIRPVVGGEAPPGRALLVRRGRAVPVQVAHWR